MEVNTRGQYENEQKLEDIEEFVLSNGFKLVGGNTYDRIYMNKTLSQTIEDPKIKFIET